MFGDTGGKRIGEVWFEGTEGAPLLGKYIFTSERLSIQDHPDEQYARERGLAGGKEECWFVLDAEPGAVLGLGLTSAFDKEKLRRAALDSSIVDLVEWKPVQMGDYYYVPAGTVHAIGAGISLLEFQQNRDITFRLYDYGRPRDLHLDEGIAVARRGPYADPRSGKAEPERTRVLADGPPFFLIHAAAGDWRGDNLSQHRRWVLPIDAQVHSGDLEAGPGECLLVEPGTAIEIDGGRALIGGEGAASQ
jgi:mannose-6-phosphate isomerase